MSLNEMVVFNQYVKPAVIETLAQMVNKFNEASGGAIRLTTTGFDGDFLQESFWSSIHSAQRRVDRYTTNEAVSTTDLSQLKHSSVKVAGGFGPIRLEPSQLTWIQKPTQEGIEMISRNFAEALLADQLNTAILSLVTAIQNQSTATYDASALSPAQGISYVTMNNAHAKFGDHSNRLITQVMTGSVMHKLIGQNLANAERLFYSDTVQIVDILGRRIVVTDADALYETVSGGSNLEKVLSLVENAAIVHDGGDIVTNVQTNNGKERIETTVQMDYSFGVGLKGYAWDETQGGASPSDADLATANNWDKLSTSIKHTAGVITIGDATVE